MSKNQTLDVAERAKINQVNVFCAFDEIVETEALKENPKNPNTHPEEQIKLLADIIKRTGWRAPITVSTRSGYIVKGHGRLKAAKLAGFESVPVEYQNFTSDDEENAALLADNKIAEFSEIDSKLLAQMFEDFNFEEYGDLTGYSEDEYKELIDVIEEAQEVADLDTIVLPAEKGQAFTKPGDLWILGRHRLVCGDSRDTDTYIRLMEDDIADMVITDPPYNVDYEGATGLKIANDNLSDSEFYKFLLDCFTPTRYVIGDERDRWATSAGDEGDPWELSQARQITFYNRKSVEVSTPTTKDASNIESSFKEGTQERWCHQCPHCGEYTNIVFDHIKFDYTSKIVKGKEFYNVTILGFACPHCGCITSEEDMRKQPAKWIAENPEAYENGHRSFWLNAFTSPWTPWQRIVKKFLEARKDPEQLKVVFNTLFGELWEDRGDLADEDEMLDRREEYNSEYLPDGVLALTCGVDTQDNRLEYEIVGHGLYGETWGIKKGYIMGRPDSPQVWKRLDDAIDHIYYLKNGRGLKVTITCVDSGGHFTQDVYEQCRLRMNKRVFPIKGKGGDGIPFVGKPNKVFIKGDKRKSVWLYSIGVDAGKSIIMDNLRVQEPGAKYCHFPKNEGLNYDMNFFNGLLSEKMELSKTKSGNRWCWVKLPGHRSNEALDCRNYALAAFRIWDPDMDAIQKRLLEPITKKVKAVHKPKKRVTKSKLLEGGEW